MFPIANGLSARGHVPSCKSYWTPLLLEGLYGERWGRVMGVAKVYVYTVGKWEINGLEWPTNFMLTIEANSRSLYSSKFSSIRRQSILLLHIYWKKWFSPKHRGFQTKVLHQFDVGTINNHARNGEAWEVSGRTIFLVADLFKHE